MKTDLKLSIPNPCAANWNEMTPVEQGKFCGLCSLTVVDFTEMSEAEIKEYFTCHYGQKTCGRFKTVQLSQPEIPTKNFWKTVLQKTEQRFRQSSFRTIVLCGLTFCALVIGCRRTSTTNPPPHLMGDIETMGEPKFEQVDTTKVTAPAREENLIKGKIKIVE